MKKMSVVLCLFIICVVIFNGCNKKDMVSSNNKIDNKNIKVNSDSVDNFHNDAKDYTDINVFWNDFKNDLLNENWDAIERFVEFPIHTRGPLDGYPIVYIEKDKYKEMIKLFLNQDDGKDFRTNREYFQELKNLNIDDLKISDDEKLIRIGDMEFMLVNDNWKLVFVYLSDENYEKLGIDI